MEMPNMNTTDRKIYVLMVIAAFVWAGAFIAGKFAVPYIPVFTLTFIRFLIATAVMYVIMKIYDKSFPEQKYSLSKKDFPFFMFTGIVGMFGYHVLFFTSLKYTTAINSSMIGATNPVITAIIVMIITRKMVPGKQLLGIVISFIGVALTIMGPNAAQLSPLSFNVGDIVMLAAVLCWALYAVISKRKGGHIPPFALTFYSFLICTIALIPFSLMEKPWTLSGIPASAVVAVVFMAVFSSAVGYTLQQIALKKIGAARASIFVNLVPVFSMILSVLILHEQLFPVKILAAAVIIGGVYLCQRS